MNLIVLEKLKEVKIADMNDPAIRKECNWAKGWTIMVCLSHSSAVSHINW